MTHLKTSKSILPACWVCTTGLARHLHALAPGNLVQGCLSALIFQESSYQLQDQCHLDANKITVIHSASHDSVEIKADACESDELLQMFSAPG